MRLIDADKLYDWIRTECNPYGKPTIDFKSGNRMLDIIKRMPTAFDKEKVIEELKSNMGSAQLAQLLAGTDLVQRGGFLYGYYNGIKDAIEIVEKGGIE